MSTINFQCPHCSHSMQVAESVVGQQGNCPSCGKATVITASPAPPQAAPPLQTPQPLPEYPRAAPQSKSTHGSAKPTDGKPYIKKVLSSLIGATSPEPVGNERYPNLTRYLDVMDILIRIFFMIALVLLILAVVLGILGGGYTIILAVKEGFSNVWDGLGLIVGSILGGAFYYLVLIWVRLVTLASLEMIRVFMDTESNTRKLLAK